MPICKLQKKLCQLSYEINRVRLPGLEPGPTWLRAKYAAANTLDACKLYFILALRGLKSHTNQSSTTA